MKVLQVINKLERGGGAEKFALDLALALNKFDDIELEFLSISKPSKENMEFINLLKKNGIKTTIFNSNNVYALSNLLKLMFFLKKSKFDIVNAHLFPTLYYCGLSGLLNSKTCFVYTEHSTSNKRRKNILFKLVDWVIYRFYHRVICITDKVKDNLVEHVKIKKALIINNGIDVNSFYSAIPLNKGIIIDKKTDSDIKLILMSARFIDSKDYKTLFDSLDFLPDNFHIICLGEGPNKNSMISYCSNKEWCNQVHFLGLRNDVPRLLKSCDIVVLSTEYEGFSISMLEGMAAYKPFIASRVPGVEDLVDGIALLFNYGDSKELAGIIKELISNTQLYDEVANRCLSFAMNFDISKTADYYYELYKSQLNLKTNDI